MTLQELQREKIYHALIEFRKNFDGSQRDFCKMWDINPSSYSTLLTAIRECKPLVKIISDDKLVIIGRKLNVNFKNEATWNVVRTQTFEHITAQLEYCQEKSISRIFCDLADIGKTAAAKHYMLTHQNVFYVDCGQCTDKGDFIRAIAKAVGVANNGSVKDVYRNTVYMLQAMARPLIILDEWGDLTYSAFLTTKHYWNALEDACGFYMMGADGLRAKIERGINRKSVGFAEMYRRMGGEFQSVTGKMDPAEVVLFRKRQVQDLAYANLQDPDQIKEVIKNTMSLTRVKENIKKVTSRPPADSANQENQAAA